MNTKELLHPGAPLGESARRAMDSISRFVTVILFLATTCLRADQVEMQNGDRYLGTVLSLDTNTLVLRSAVLGTVTLPRGKVALIHLGSGGSKNLPGAASAVKPEPAASSVAITNGMTDLSAPLRWLGAGTNFIEQVRAQFLADAGPEANNKFNAMVGGLLSGRLTVNDIRVEAKSAANQLKELKRDLGEDAGGAVDGYLAILENFLRETAPPSGVSTTNVSRAFGSRRKNSGGHERHVDGDVTTARVRGGHAALPE